MVCEENEPCLGGGREGVGGSYDKNLQLFGVHWGDPFLNPKP